MVGSSQMYTTIVLGHDLLTKYSGKTAYVKKTFQYELGITDGMSHNSCWRHSNLQAATTADNNKTLHN